VSVAYKSVAQFRAELYRRGIVPAYRSPARVISIGNLTLGGTGKTPLTVKIAKALADKGRKSAIVTRGYGGESDLRAAVVSNSSDAREVGDEALMMAAALPNVPVIKSTIRKYGIELAIENSAATSWFSTTLSGILQSSVI